MSNEIRRQTLGNKGFAYRHPKVFIFTGILISMGIIFSKPLYDIFFMEQPSEEEMIMIRQRTRDRLRG